MKLVACHRGTMPCVRTHTYRKRSKARPAGSANRPTNSPTPSSVACACRAIRGLRSAQKPPSEPRWGGTWARGAWRRRLHPSPRAARTATRARRARRAPLHFARRSRPSPKRLKKTYWRAPRAARRTWSSWETPTSDERPAQLGASPCTSWTSRCTWAAGHEARSEPCSHLRRRTPLLPRRRRDAAQRTRGPVLAHLWSRPSSKVRCTCDDSSKRLSLSAAARSARRKAAAGRRAHKAASCGSGAKHGRRRRRGGRRGGCCGRARARGCRRPTQEAVAAPHINATRGRRRVK